MINTIESAKCTGCEACASICPSSAIHMEIDAEGLQMPCIDYTLCKSCGACQRVCPVHGAATASGKKIKVAYAAYSRNMEERANSSSGGIFSLLAKEIINSGGVVYGAAFDDVKSVSHKRIETLDGLHKLQKSKYLQSRINESYKQCKADLALNKPVLFTGTPCQIAGLKSYLGETPENLFSVSVICHGVPSEAVWKKYISKLQNDSKHIVTSADFRCKTAGWKNYSLFYTFDNGSTCTIKHEEDAFFHGFNSSLFLRQSCYQCKFKEPNNYADISLGDFWACSTMAPVMDDGMGASVVLINTIKGKSLFESIKTEMRYMPINYEITLDKHSAIKNSSLGIEKRKLFYSAFPDMDICKLIFQLAPKEKTYTIHNCLIYYLKMVYRKFMKHEN